MRWVVAASVRSRGIVVALAVVVMAIGVAQYRDMPRDSLPEFRPPTVEVQTEALGLSAPEVEQLITVPLEQDLLDGVAFLDAIHSESVAGVSRIELVFEPGTDVGRARQVVNERLTQAHGLPQVSQPPQMLQPLSSTSRVMMVGLSSEDLSLIDLSVLARWSIRPRLMGVPGVGNVAIWGQRDRQLQVQVDPVRLENAGVALEDVIRTAGNALWTSPLTFLEASTPGVGGFFETPSQRIGVRHELPIRSPADLARVPLEGDAGAADGNGIRRLGDVTDVVEDHQPLIGDAVLTDQPGLFIVVEKLPEANALEVTKDLDQALEEMRPGLGDVQIDTSVFRPARYVEQSDDALRTTLIVSGVLLILALGLLLFDWRRTVVALIGIAVALAAGVAVLAFRGESLNAMTIAGLVLALAVLVDDSVVGVEREDDDSPDPVGSIVAVRGPLGYATAIALLVLVPIALLHGEIGAFLDPLALSYAGAIIVSAIVALTVTPAMRSLLRANGSGATQSPLVRWSAAHYSRAIGGFLARPVLTGITLVGLLVVGLVGLPLLERDTSLVPEFQDRDLLVRWNAVPGTSLSEMARVTRRAAAELQTLPGVDSAGAHVGRAVLGDQIVGTNAGELWVAIGADADYGETLATIEETLAGYPGLASQVLTYPRERIDSILVDPEGVAGRDLTVRVFGPNLAQLRSEAEKVADLARRVDGARRPEVALPTMEPTIEVEVDLERAESVGIKPGDVRRAAATLISGVVVGSLFEEQKIFDVAVWGTPENRRDVGAVRRMRLETPGGGSVALDEVADVRVVPSPNVIRHADVSHYLDVGIDVSGRDTGAVADELAARMRSVGFPLDYHAEVLRDFESDSSSSSAFLLSVLVIALGVFLLLQAAFRSWKMAAVTFLALVAATSGGVVATVIDGDAITIGTIAGFLGLVAVAARGIVVLVRTAQQLEDDAPSEEFGAELVARAGGLRLGAVLVSAVALVAIYLPVLIAGSGAGLEILHPMAVVLIGGIVTATFVTLFVVPGLHLAFGRRPEGGREDLDRELGAPPEGSDDSDAARIPVNA